jgi:hypothetical protein
MDSCLGHWFFVIVSIHSLIDSVTPQSFLGCQLVPFILSIKVDVRLGQTLFGSSVCLHRVCGGILSGSYAYNISRVRAFGF